MQKAKTPEDFSTFGYIVLKSTGFLAKRLKHGLWLKEEFIQK